MDEVQTNLGAVGNGGRRSKPGGRLRVNWRGGLWFRAATAVGAAEEAQRRFEAFTRRSSAFEVVKNRVFRMQDMAMQQQPLRGGGISRSNGKKVSQFHNFVNVAIK
jgi:hypothetical protein